MYKKLALEGASRTSSKLIVNNFVDFQNFQKFNEERILMETII